MDREYVLVLIDEMKKYKENGGKRGQSVDNLLNRAVEIQKLLSEKFALVFLTDKGIGKTTIINYMLDLMYEREKKVKSGRSVVVYQDVLETGAGATTTAETEIIQSTDYYCKIQIIPSSKEEMEDLLRDFAKYIFKEVNADFKEYGTIAPELFRAMRNMTGLKEVDKEYGEKIDLARELAKKYDMDDYLLFENEVLRRANLDYRIKTKFVIGKDDDERRAIRRIFNKINLMAIDDIPLPKKIVVQLSKDVFNFDTLGEIDRVIDTRGLESGVVATDRKDIRELFKSDKNKIIILVDKFNSPSQSIMKLIDTYIQDNKHEAINRVGYLVNFRDGEPENVVSHSGKTFIEMAGIEIKRGDIHKYIKGNNINFKLDNIIFTNPKRYLDPNGKILIDEEDIEDYGTVEEARKAKKEIRLEKKKELLSDIYRITENYKNELLMELEILSEEFKSIKNKDIEDLNLDFNKIINSINEFNMSDKEIEDFLFVIFEEYILSSHHSSLMALNKRYGIYQNRDIYLVGSDKIERYFRNSLKNITLLVIDSILSQIISEEDKKKVGFIINDIKKYYFNFMDEINKFVYEYLKNSIFNQGNTDFWEKSTGRWGKGNGYIQDIASYYKEQLEKEKLDCYIKNATFEWVRTFKNGLIAILKQNV